MLLSAATAWAVGGANSKPAFQVNAVTGTCQKEIGAAADKYTKKRIDTINKCLDAALKCDEQSTAAKAEDCRRKLIEVDKGKCARGKLDSGATTIGAGASVGKSKSDKPTLDKELAKWRDAIGKKCTGPGLHLGEIINGLAYPGAPFITFDEVVDVVNGDPGGVSCLANEQVFQTTPQVDAITAVLLPLEDATHEVAAVLKEDGGGMKRCATAGGGPPTCCGATRIGYTSQSGTLHVDGLVFPFPAGVSMVVDVDAGDSQCRHSGTVKTFNVPTFCITGLNFSSKVTATGCETAAGGAIGAGTLWDASSPCADADVIKLGDTSAAPCGTLGTACTKGSGTGAGDDILGDVDTTKGAAGCDAAGVQQQWDIPQNSLTWIDAESLCPDADGQYDPGTDLLVTNFNFILSLTTASATGAFDDKDGDSCAFAGSGPAGPVTDFGFPPAGPCCQVGQTLRLVGTGPIWSGAAPLYDLMVRTISPNTVTSCSAFVGGGSCTPTTSSCLQ